MKARQQFLDRIKYMKKEHREYLEKMFLKCPDQVMDAMKYMKIPPNYNLINAGDNCEYVYLILKGRAKGTDIQVYGNVYNFMEYSELTFLGDYEVLGDLKNYRASIKTLTQCEIISIPSAVYLEWLKRDVNALFMRTQMLMKVLTDQTAEERKYLFLTCKERLILYLVSKYERNGNNKTYRLNKTQSELAERLGFNVRTLQRNISTLEMEGMISTESGKICITKEQYEKMRNMNI